MVDTRPLEEVVDVEVGVPIAGVGSVLLDVIKGVFGVELTNIKEALSVAGWLTGEGGGLGAVEGG